MPGIVLSAFFIRHPSFLTITLGEDICLNIEESVGKRKFIDVRQ